MSKQGGILFSLATNKYMNAELITNIAESLNVSKVKVIIGRDHERTSYEKFDFVMRTDCIYGNFDNYQTQMEPLDDNVIDSMGKYALEIMSMWQRFEDFYNFQIDRTMEQRVNIYLANLCYWNSVLKNENIKYAVFTDVPHEGYDAIIYYLIKTVYTKVKVILRYVSRIPGKDILLQDLSDLNLQNYLKGAVDNFEGGGTNEMKNYYFRLSESRNSHVNGSFPGANNRSEWLRKRFGNQSFLKAFCEIQELNFINYCNDRDAKLMLLLKFGKAIPYSISTFIQNIPKIRYAKSQHRKTEKFIAEYEALTEVKNDKEIPKLPYVYYAMHYQPEATSLPLGGGIYSHQEIPIQILADAIPDNWKILVKKHPGQLSQCANAQIYKKLVKNKKILLCSDEVSTHELITHSHFVSTLTGTVAMEALFLKKTALIFGYSELVHAPNAIKVRTVEDVKAAIDSGKIPEYSDEEIKSYFFALDNISFPQGAENYAEEIKKIFKTV